MANSKKLVELGLLIRECLALFSDFDSLGAWLGPAEEHLAEHALGYGRTSQPRYFEHGIDGFS